LSLQFNVRVFTGHQDAIRDIILLPHFGYVASCSVDGTVLIWNYVTGETLQKYHHDKHLRCLLLLRAKGVLLAGTEDGQIVSFFLPSQVRLCFSFCDPLSLFFDFLFFILPSHAPSFFPL
jgi:WD40 repeat protein